MNEARRVHENAADEIVLERVFDAPRELVFRNWTEAEQLGAWFAPSGFTVTSSQFDARPGGRWRIEFQSVAGARHIEHGEILELVAPERLVFTLTQEDGTGHRGPLTTVTVDFAEQRSKTAMLFRQSGFASTKTRDGNALGWGECFLLLDANLAAEREIRAIFDAWSDASTKKDLEASMGPIAPDVLSYEHEAPLQYRGVDAIRPVCQRGFDATPDEFRWDVPDLRVVVRGDIAITWGLNRMRGPELLLSSRGTRVFQKIGGRWLMIHQHVSFPMDPSTGMAKTDLPLK